MPVPIFLREKSKIVYFPPKRKQNDQVKPEISQKKNHITKHLLKKGKKIRSHIKTDVKSEYKLS